MAEEAKPKSAALARTRRCPFLALERSKGNEDMTDTLCNIDGMLNFASVEAYPKKSAAIHEFIFNNYGYDCSDILIDMFGCRYDEETDKIVGLRLSQYREFSDSVKRRWYKMSTDREVDNAWEWIQGDEVWTLCNPDDEGAKEFWELWRD